MKARCISYYSYIKPQRDECKQHLFSVVYRTIPTSNHNALRQVPNMDIVVYRTIPTSNHNYHQSSLHGLRVVYRTIPTSNHNL